MNGARSGPAPPDPAVAGGAATARRWLVPLGLAAAVAVLAAAGRGDLAAPPADLRRLGVWIDEQGAVAAAVVFVRLAALVAAASWAVAASVAVAARTLGAVPVAVAAERVLPLPVRRAVAGAALALTAAACGDQPASGPDGAPLVLLPAEQPATGTAVMSLLDDEPPAPEPPPAPPPPAPAADEWVVAPGESFWSIAEDVVGDALGRAPSDREVAAYWRVLVDANRERLVSGEPDLVHPGQVFTVPPVR